MKNDTKPTLVLRAQSIRDLTAAEMRFANGGCCSGSAGCRNNVGAQHAK